MNYTIDDLIDLIARRDEHEAYYRTKLVEALAEHDRRVSASAWDDGYRAALDDMDGPDWGDGTPNPHRAGRLEAQ